MKNNGDHLFFGYEDKCEEWPCVGDEVVLDDCKGTVIAIDGDMLWVLKDTSMYETYHVDSVKKPKTPEEELRDEVGASIHYCNIEGKTEIEAAKYLLAKFNITKKPLLRL